MLVEMRAALAATDQRREQGDHQASDTGHRECDRRSPRGGGMADGRIGNHPARMRQCEMGRIGSAPLVFDGVFGKRSGGGDGDEVVALPEGWL